MSSDRLMYQVEKWRDGNTAVAFSLSLCLFLCYIFAHFFALNRLDTESQCAWLAVARPAGSLELAASHGLGAKALHSTYLKHSVGADSVQWTLSTHAHKDTEFEQRGLSHTCRRHILKVPIPRSYHHLEVIVRLVLELASQGPEDRAESFHCCSSGCIG